jgi:GT2 family glycosyltransferase
LIDDASPGWNTVSWDGWPERIVVPNDMPKEQLIKTTRHQLCPSTKGTERVLCYHYTKNSGLTRSWNMGLRLGWKNTDWASDIIVCGNSDIVFTPNWSDGLIEGLQTCALVGPTTNASGRVTQQNIRQFMRGYKLTDNPGYLASLVEALHKRHGHKVKHTWRVNGFFMMAKAATWWAGAYDKDHVFNPKERMDNSAYELQARWRRKGWRIGIVPRSFIFHYRSVSRGQRGLHGECGRGAWRPKSQ